ncbi:MAG TPA: STAS domain-containing protein [Acidimicrobiia bacterium]|nr:STAS domain-containing protein [Acidimicrobiia bacterium]
MEEQALQPDLSLHTNRAGTRAVVLIAGDLDAYSAATLEDEVSRLLADEVSELVFDLSGTGFLDSSGLRAILASEREISRHGGSLVLQGPSDPVRRLLEITGLTDHFVLES